MARAPGYGRGSSVCSYTPPLCWAQACWLVLAADFADGTLQGLAHAVDGALVLAADAALGAEQRPRAYAERAAWGTFVSPPRDLARSVTQVEATLDADLPSRADALLEVRGRTLQGRWTPWTEVELGGASASSVSR
jgi:hypothetical protein